MVKVVATAESPLTERVTPKMMRIGIVLVSLIAVSLIPLHLEPAQADPTGPPLSNGTDYNIQFPNSSGKGIGEYIAWNGTFKDATRDNDTWAEWEIVGDQTYGGDVYYQFASAHNTADCLEYKSDASVIVDTCDSSRSSQFFWWNTVSSGGDDTFWNLYGASSGASPYAQSDGTDGDLIKMAANAVSGYSYFWVTIQSVP